MGTHRSVSQSLFRRSPPSYFTEANNVLWIGLAFLAVAAVKLATGRFTPKAILALLVLAVLAFIGLFIMGRSKDKASRYGVSKLQLYRKPILVAIHLEDSAGVFVIRNAGGRNAMDFLEWISPKNADIRSIDINASSIYESWSNATEDRDTIQFGIHGFARGKTRPTFEGDNAIHVGVAQEDFPSGSFSILSDKEFRSMGLPTPAAEFTVTGSLLFSTHHLKSFRTKPRHSPF